MKIQEQWGYDEVPPEAVMSTSQRRVWIFLRDNIGQTVSDISENTGYPAKGCRQNYRDTVKKICHYRGRIWTIYCRLTGRV